MKTEKFAPEGVQKRLSRCPRLGNINILEALPAHNSLNHRKQWLSALKEGTSTGKNVPLPADETGLTGALAADLR